MITEAFAAFEALKQGFGLAKGGLELNMQRQIDQALFDIQRNLLEMQSAAFEDKQTHAKLVAQIDELKQEIIDFQSWETEKARYIMTESELGTITYDLRPECANDEIHHRLCSNCYLNGRKSILHGRRHVVCQACGSQMRVENAPPVRVRKSSDW